MALALEDEELGARIAGIRITNLRFADDISLLAESEGELQHLVNRVSQTSTRFGLIASKPNYRRLKCSVFDLHPLRPGHAAGKLITSFNMA